MCERLLPSQLEIHERCADYATERLCDEIRACWSELELLRAVALEAASLHDLPPALREAVEAWQASNRKKS